MRQPVLQGTNIHKLEAIAELQCSACMHALHSTPHLDARRQRLNLFLSEAGLRRGLAKQRQDGLACVATNDRHVHLRNGTGRTADEN